jgi:hypothetical protein
MPNFTATNSLNGLQTTTLFQAPTTGVYFVNGQLTLPVLRDQPSNIGALISTPEIGGSQVVAVVKDGATTVFTGNAGATGFQTTFTATAGDVITCILSSSANIDNQLNAVKGVVSSGQSF